MTEWRDRGCGLEVEVGHIGGQIDGRQRAMHWVTIGHRNQSAAMFLGENQVKHQRLEAIVNDDSVVSGDIVGNALECRIIEQCHVCLTDCHVAVAQMSRQPVSHQAWRPHCQYQNFLHRSLLHFSFLRVLERLIYFTRSPLFCQPPEYAKASTARPRLTKIKLRNIILM